MQRPPIRLISWNVARRTRRVADQIEHLRTLQPDIVALQEVAFSSTDTVRVGLLERLGLTHFRSSLELAGITDAKTYGQIVASRFPLDALPPEDFPVPRRELVLSVVIQSCCGPIEAHNAHVPNGSKHKWKKIETLEGIASRLGRRHDGHRFLCGDFNIPQIEPAVGPIIYWDQERLPDGSLRRRRDQRWGDGERGVHEGLAEYDLADAYRALHGVINEEARSWVPNHGRVRVPRRFDHLYASRSLGVNRCEYIHSPRLEGLSDHSLLLAEFRPGEEVC